MIHKIVKYRLKFLFPSTGIFLTFHPAETGRKNDFIARNLYSCFIRLGFICPSTFKSKLPECTSIFGHVISGFRLFKKITILRCYFLCNIFYILKKVYFNIYINKYKPYIFIIHVKENNV